MSAKLALEWIIELDQLRMELEQWQSGLLVLQARARGQHERTKLVVGNRYVYAELAESMSLLTHLVSSTIGGWSGSYHSCLKQLNDYIGLLEQPMLPGNATGSNTSDSKSK